MSPFISLGVDATAAASALMTSVMGEAQNEDEKADVVEGLLDTRLLPATNEEGVIFNNERLQQR